MLRKKDNELRQEVLDELEWDSRVEWPALSAIDVAVKDGVVTLTGTVSNYAGKMAAQEAAHTVRGVFDVVNNIQVEVERGHLDAETARAVRSALAGDVLVPDDRIHATVADGWVTLAGDVNNLRQRADAERAVLHLAGVVGVINNIVVKPPHVDPEELRSGIEEALERRAEREAERLRIKIEDGVVGLWGRVHSWQERRAVVGSISHAPGVREVNDHLRVDPYF
jgi:osmotically-inducible protein OsmY